MSTIRHYVRACWWLGLFGSLGLLGILTAHAEDEQPAITFQAGPDWKEDTVRVPAYPDSADLVAVPLHLALFPFQLFIDRNSLQLGADQVSRYVAVLESSSGARNVFFEGIRCASGEFRTYAVGVGEGGFDASVQTEWRTIQQLGADQFRHVLETEVFCDGSKRARDVEQVLTLLRKGVFLGEEY